MKLSSFLIAVVCSGTSVSARRRGSPSFSVPAYGARNFGITTREHEYRESSVSSPFEDGVPQESSSEVHLVSASKVLGNVVKGALLRIGSDLSGGTPLENIKCRVTTTKENGFEAARSLIKNGGIGALWSGTSSRTVEGALLGAFFVVGSTVTKKQMLRIGSTPIMASLAAGMVGGLAQAIVMTPSGLIFTSLNVNKGKPGYENDTAISVTKRILKEKGLMGMYAGSGPMCARQATNWASRSGFTEIARASMSQYGMLGEIGSGVIGGLGSCWNTPIETVRVNMHKDISEGNPPKTFGGYMGDIYQEEGVPGLFRGVTPRGVQAIWQTVFMVVFPTMLGM